VVSAVKQSRKAWKPQLNEMTSFKKFIAAHTDGPRYIAHCYDEIPRVNLFDHLRQQESDDALVLIGPEGDFSIEEVRQAVDAGFVSVDLGRSRLRTETAGLAAVMMMQLAKQ
jgi:16S rRNA (uracil1498-N3)-methyltransferase